MENTGLKVVIIGAGLAGLATARILREKHTVTVYERGDPSVSPVGQGIMSTPNSTKVLDLIGFDTTRARACVLEGWRMCSHTGELRSNAAFDFVGQFGATVRSQMRVDFRDELLRLATAPSAELGITGRPASMVWNNGVVELDPDGGVVTLQNGTRVEADLIVVADGVHSRLRSAVLGSDEYCPRKTGFTCYRVALDTATAQKALGYVPEWWQPKAAPAGGRGNFYQADDGSGRTVIMYPLRNFDGLNISATFRTPDKIKGKDMAWNADGDLEDIAPAFADFDPEIKTLIGAGENVKVWELHELEPIPTYTRGRAILIGDAAHAMTPTQGQGANVAIEDADAFRLFVADGAQILPEDVPGVLAKIDSVRRPRVKRVLENSRYSMRPDRDEREVFRRMMDTLTYDGIFAELDKLDGSVRSTL